MLTHKFKAAIDWYTTEDSARLYRYQSIWETSESSMQQTSPVGLVHAEAVNHSDVLPGVSRVESHLLTVSACVSIQDSNNNQGRYGDRNTSF